MRRILFLMPLVFVAFVLASPAQADSRDKWRGGGWDHHHRDGHHEDHERGPGDYPHAQDTDRERHDGDRRDDRGSPPWLDRREHDRAREGVIHGRMMPLERLENEIGRSMPGFRIGNPELLMFGGRPVYRIRWRTPDGHILVVFADAETGQLLDVRGR